jgi:predicted small lipoprotein YifL
MKRFLLPIVVLGMLATLAGCSYNYAEERPPADEPEQAWQNNIDNLTTLFDSLSFPQHLVSPSPTLQGNEFDVMDIFETLDHLHQADGYLLAYYYHHDGMGGFPVLYTRKTEEEPYLNGDAFALAHPECIKPGSNHNECSFIDYVLTDGSSLGYLQLLLLAMSGNQFYLDWHACYNDKRPVATKEAINLLVDSLEDSGLWLPMTGKQAKAARAIDPLPVVELSEDQVLLRVVWFTRWGGFYESLFRLNSSPPYNIMEEKQNLLLEYDCGVRF